MKTYIATPAEVKRLTLDILKAAQEAAEGPRTYLRLVVGTTIHELGAKALKRVGGRHPKLTPEESQRQLAALDAVNERFYAAVVEAAEQGLPPGRDRAKLLNRRTNFARSAVSTVRSYIRAGHDLRRIVVERCTKRSLQVERAVRPPTPARMRRRVEARSKAFITSLIELSETDKAAAIEEMQLAVGQITHQLMELGIATPVRDLRRAAEMGVPLRSAGGKLFVPVTETQVLRQQARPS